MRKKVLSLATVLAVAVAAIAYAQTQTNTYDVQANTSPKKAGTSKKAVPVGIEFNFQVGEANNLRPAVIEKYSIKFGGLRTNTNSFPGCTPAQLRADKDACDKAIVGSGFVKNNSGAVNNKSDRSVVCNLELTVYNSRNNRGMLLLEGGPGQPENRVCPIEFGPANGIIPTNYVRSRSGSALEFTVPENLRHPLATLDNSLYDSKTNIKRMTVRRKGKTKGYYESIGGCRNGRRSVTVTFTPEDGPAQRASTFAACSR
jgi:hypothetical protein